MLQLSEMFGKIAQHEGQNNISHDLFILIIGWVLGFIGALLSTFAGESIKKAKRRKEISKILMLEVRRHRINMEEEQQDIINIGGREPTPVSRLYRINYSMPFLNIYRNEIGFFRSDTVKYLMYFYDSTREIQEAKEYLRSVIQGKIKEENFDALYDAQLILRDVGIKAAQELEPFLVRESKILRFHRGTKSA